MKVILCEDVGCSGEGTAPAVWLMAEYVNTRPSVSTNSMKTLSVTEFNACEACANYWVSVQWANVKRVARIEQEREIIPLSPFSFHRDYHRYTFFEIHIMDGGSKFDVQVRGWGDTVRNLRQFIAGWGDPAAVQGAMRDVYHTGYGSIGTMNVRLVPIA